MKVHFRYPHLFLYWWLITAPKYLFTLIKRVIILINSQISFTLNLQLLFTPLFGDYTVVGRLIGFVVRIFEIFFGTVILGFLCTLSVLIPFFWLVFPIMILVLQGLLLIPFVLAVYLLWNFAVKDIPLKKVNECGSDEMERACRPLTLEFLNLLKDNRSDAILKITATPTISYLLKKTELLNEEFIQKLSTAPGIDLNQLKKKCWEMARESKLRYVEPELVITAYISCIPNADTILATYGSKLDLVIKSTKWVVENREILEKLYIWQPDYETMLTGGTGKGMTGRVTPYLNAMSEDFTKKAIQGNYKRYAVREDSIRKMAELLGGSNENILVIGAPGSGKTSLVRGIAYKIMEGTTYKSLNNKRIVSIELSGIVSGTAGVGEIAEKLKRAISEAKASGDIILFIDEIHTLIAGGNSHPEISALYSILEPELASNTIQFIGATTIQNYRKYIEPNGAFSRLFNIYEITEASKDETIEILKYDVKTLEYKHDLFITYPALEKAVDLSRKLIHERVLPDKAIQIIQRAATRVSDNTKYLDSKAVALEIADMTHIPASLVTEDEAKKLLSIEEDLKQMVIGQDEAIKQVGSAIKRARAGVRNESKPIASFLFVGTTGVGKTQTAKALAKIYFGDVKNMVRLDMSEYQQLDAISRLLGTPDGTIKGILTESIRTRPFCLLLLDEIEKAHPNILLTFLQVLDDGRLTDTSGVTIDFTNTIIIATSNVGTRAIQEVFSKQGSIQEMQDIAMREVRSHFAPEFLNRFTGISVFNPLTLENVKKITRMLLADVAKSTAEQGITVKFEESVINELTIRGFNPEWGARPMARVIEDTVQLYLAEKILAKEIKQGDIINLGMEVFTAS
ncbi:ATP-dependent Clp protease ATP-binding subunit [candidate division WWE3 bacterium]|uniref:ATP-dependent Clp protease ATP-binding subunit n=1 Tax=candidate division WWE3 bacterium TaxID=2053526 RepID=A0A7X9DKR5_UNCKA|nr:ATP-dependent Clp protease ATP-binding subunit [candidate division WWE3 bacterium]